MRAEHDPLWLVGAIGAMAFCSYLFFKGLHERRAITRTNLKAERDRTPVIYWTFQAYYALGAIMFAFLIVLFASDYKFDGTSVTGKLLLALAGSLFLFGAMLCGIAFAIGLRTGVAIRQVWISEPSPPSRKTHPFRYWGLQTAYVFYTVLLTVIGLAAIWVTVK